MWQNHRLAALGMTLLCAVASGLVAASLATGTGALPEHAAGSHPGLAVPAVSPEPVHGQARVPRAAAPAPSASPARAPSRPAPTPSPVVLSAAVTPAPDAPSPPPMVTPVPQTLTCPPYPILLDPAPDLAAATQGAIAMWAAYLGCPAFELGSGGLRVRYEPDWPGDCLDPDIAACTMNGIFLSPAEPLYHPQSVVAHELGHVLNFEHGEGPAVMDPARWSGPSTVWCDLNRRCGP